MKLSIHVVISVITIALFSISSCGRGKYSDVKELMNDQIEIMESFARSMEEAENAEDVAAAIKIYTKKIKALHPKLQRISNKYPELMKDDNPPDELKTERERMAEAGRRLQAAMTKNMKYMMNSDVQKALTNMSLTEK